MKKKDFIALFEPDLFIPVLKAGSKKKALEEMVQHLAGHNRIDSEQVILNTLNQREKLGSTGIGESLAVPHSRSLVVSKLLVLFARSKKGINFDAIDKKPVHLIFLILAPPQDPGNRYLPLLGKIVEVIRDQKIKDLLMKAEEFDDFITALQESHG